MDITIKGVTTEEFRYLACFLEQEAALGGGRSWQIADSIRKKMVCDAKNVEIAQLREGWNK